MKIGSFVKLIDNKPKNQWTAKIGAKALVVDGKKNFPDLFKQLSDTLSFDPNYIEEFIWVEWDKKDIYWNNQKDGAYANWRFTKIEDPLRFSEEPKNNDGRHSCFWCKASTITQQGFSSCYNICPNCKK